MIAVRKGILIALEGRREELTGGTCGGGGGDGVGDGGAGGTSSSSSTSY